MSIGTLMISPESGFTDGTKEIPSELLKRLQSCRTLPSVPTVIVKILDMVQNLDDICVSDLVKVIIRDPALTAKILKVANSAWCGVSREVTTLEQAIALLGLTGTMSLALSFSLVRGMRNRGGESFNYHQYWRRAIITTTATVETGLLMKAAHREELRLVGLLQDIGILVLSEVLPEYGYMTAEVMSNHAALIDVEHRELQTDHAQVGAWFLRRWGLPKTLINTILDSHNQSKGDRSINDAAALGSRIADFWMNANSATALREVAVVAKSLFSMTPDQLNEIMTRIADNVQQMLLDLDIDIGNEMDFDNLLDQSREAIAEINVQMVCEARGLAAQVQRDPLTSLYNRTYLNQVLDTQFARSSHLCMPLTALFIDVDCFKNINDTYGHAAGDIILVEVAKAIQSSVRNYDTVVRFGGDEFVALLSNASEQIGAEVAERIRAQVDSQLFDIDNGSEIHVTVSLGRATMMPESDITNAKELLALADKNLYCAKSAGRNCVV